MRSLVDERNNHLEQLQAEVANYNSNTTTNIASNIIQQLLGNDIGNSTNSPQSAALQISEYQLQSLLIKKALEGLNTLFLETVKLETGVYFIEVKTANGNMISQKFIKQ